VSSARIKHLLSGVADWNSRRQIRRQVGGTTAQRPQVGWMNSALKSRAQVETALDEVRRCGLVPHNDRPKNWDAVSALRLILERTRADARVLEVGAALYSVMLPWLYQYGYRQLHGVDLVLGKPVRWGPIVYEHGDLTHTHFQDASFDVICSMSVIEHGVPVDCYFQEMSRLLAPGGLLITSTDYWSDPVDTAGLVAYGAPVKIFTRREMENLLDTGSQFGLTPTGPVDLECGERSVTWERYRLSYTFVCFALEKPAHC
jgi:SAM-dependent methyltransferase